jgi:ribosome maturation protein Sdo1
MKPFHESVVRVIKSITSVNELELIEKLLMTTKIPKGHDEIAAALLEKTTKLKQMNFFSTEVFLSINEQKKFAQAVAAEKAAAQAS